MPYKKSEMVYDDYTWTNTFDNDDPAYIQAQDNSELNKTEGYEVLNFINSIHKGWGWPEHKHSYYKKMERMIRLHMPSDIRTRIEIRDWLAQEWLKH